MGEVVPIRQGELFTEREALEALNTEQLVNYILEKGREVSEIERMMNLAAEVLEGYGTTIEEQLRERDVAPTR